MLNIDILYYNFTNYWYINLLNRIFSNFMENVKTAIKLNS